MDVTLSLLTVVITGIILYKWGKGVGYQEGYKDGVSSTEEGEDDYDHWHHRDKDT